MVIFSRVTREEMAANHAAAGPVRLPPKTTGAPTSRPRNIGAVLDLGNLIYFNFRGRPYGVPALSYKAGERLKEVWIEATSFQGALTRETAPRYHALIAQLPALLWRYTRPVGRLRRFLRALGLHPNPFRHATEQELVDLTENFLQRRTKSSVYFQTAADRHRSRTA